MELADIQKAYSRWAPHYDFSFGVISDWGRQFVVEEINHKPGHVLEVGVGTGLALPLYNSNMKITGIDVSEGMLEKARERVQNEKLRNVNALENMDATDMDFATESFDSAVAMFIMSVAPQPEAILQEMARVVKKGGDIYIVNHFASNHKIVAMFERIIEPVCRMIGWHSKFDKNRLMNCPDLELVRTKKMRPLGLFECLHFKKK